jgi:uncharacterized membrane protein YesL
MAEEKFFGNGKPTMINQLPSCFKNNFSNINIVGTIFSTGIADQA